MSIVKNLTYTLQNGVKFELSHAVSTSSPSYVLYAYRPGQAHSYEPLHVWYQITKINNHRWEITCSKLRYSDRKPTLRAAYDRCMAHFSATATPESHRYAVNEIFFDINSGHFHTYWGSFDDQNGDLWNFYIARAPYGQEWNGKAEHRQSGHMEIINGDDYTKVLANLKASAETAATTYVPMLTRAKASHYHQDWQQKATQSQYPPITPTKGKQIGWMEFTSTGLKMTPLKDDDK